MSLMLVYPPGRMRLTSKRRPSYFWKIGAMRATVLESTRGMDFQRSDVGTVFPLTCASQSSCSRSQNVCSSCARPMHVSWSLGEGFVEISGSNIWKLICSITTLIFNICLIVKHFLAEFNSLRSRDQPIHELMRDGPTVAGQRATDIIHDGTATEQRTSSVTPHARALPRQQGGKEGTQDTITS